MLGNFIFALSIGLWLNLRPLYLADLGASPEQIGLALAIGGIASGLIPLPAGILSDRIGPRRVIILAWFLALVGAAIMMLAPSWQVVTLGILIANLTWAANPAVTSFVILSMPKELLANHTERALSIVFRVWPTAMIFAPALGGWIADLSGIRTDLGISIAGFAIGSAIMWRTIEVKPENSTRKIQFDLLAKNKNFWITASFFGLLTLANYLGFTLVPNYLEDIGGLSQSAIGVLFSVSFLGTLVFNLTIERLRPRQGFLLLIVVPFLALPILWLRPASLWVWIALFLFGGISTMWIIKTAVIGRVVSESVQGLAFGVAESITLLNMSAASGMAGVLYGMTAGHELPLIAGLISIPIVLLLWLFYMRPVTGQPPKD